MDEITFIDVLSHYHLKLKEASDEMESLKALLDAAEETVDSGWEGLAAEACKLKIQDIKQELSKSLSNVSEALVTLSMITKLVATEDLTSI